MRIQEAALAAGLTSDTVRFYERKGVLPRPSRSPNGYRSYTDEHVGTLRLAAGLRRLSVRLEDVGPIFQVAHDTTCGEVRDQLTDTLVRVVGQVENQIAELNATRRQLLPILAGLSHMADSDASIPAMLPCQCVETVSQT